MESLLGSDHSICYILSKKQTHFSPKQTQKQFLPRSPLTKMFVQINVKSNLQVHNRRSPICLRCKHYVFQYYHGTIPLRSNGPKGQGCVNRQLQVLFIQIIHKNGATVCHFHLGASHFHTKENRAVYTET